MKRTIKVTITMDTEASPGWPLKAYAEVDGDPKVTPISLGRLTLTSAILTGEAVTTLILDAAKSAGIPIEE